MSFLGRRPRRTASDIPDRWQVGRQGPSRRRRWRPLLLAVVGVLVALFGTVVLAPALIRPSTAVRTGPDRTEAVPSTLRRGNILDANGHALASSVVYDSLYADPARLGDVDLLAKQLSGFVSLPPAELSAKLKVQQRTPVLLKRHLTAEQARDIRLLQRPELVLKPEWRRVHPEGDLAAAVLGTVDFEGNAHSGLEALFATELGAGRDVALTIDRFLQSLAESELERAIASKRLAAGTIIVLEPYSGAVLALAERPSASFGGSGEAQTAESGPLRAVAEADESGMPVDLFLKLGGGRQSGETKGTPEALGFGRPTGVDLPGEAPGAIETSVVKATPIQSALAMGSIANGGLLMRPMLVQQIKDVNGARTYPPALVRQAISASAARALSESLGASVARGDDGLGPVRRPEHKIAAASGRITTSGQTGTMVAGFATLDDARFVLLVRGEGATTSEAVPEVFGAVAQQLLVYFRVPPASAHAGRQQPVARGPG